MAETAYPVSVPAPRVRIESFVPFLETHDIALKYRPTMSDAEYAIVSSSSSSVRKAAVVGRAAGRLLAHRSPAHDLLLIHRARFISPLLRREPPRYVDVYDFDDALHLGSVGTRNPRFAWVSQQARRCVGYLGRARRVFAGNRYLADFASQHNRHVEVVPTCVDPTRQPLHEHVECRPLVVGWIGSPTTSPYLAQALPAFERFNRSRMQARLVVIGADLDARAPWIEQRPWSLARQAQDLASFDVGIMPL
ncbi:MAG: glycosyltransferase family protein, partial [Solirubrobacteraceae bacterium]